MAEMDFEKMEPQVIDMSNKSEGREYVEFYANFAECGFTPWDIRLLLCQTGETGLVKKATVIMAPSMVKALANLLNVNIKAYEADNGEIKMPESLVRQSAELKKAREAAVKARAGTEPGTIPEVSPEEDARAKAQSEVPKVEPTPVPKK